MAIIRTAGLAAAIALGVGISIAPAMATELPVEGGRGGSAFDQRCHKGEYLVGFHVRRGTWLDRIRILCAPHLQPRYQVGGRTFRGAPAGGGGGGDLVATCRSSDTAMGRIEFTHTWGSEEKTIAYVTGLNFTCFDLAPPHAAATPAVEVVKQAPSGGGFNPYPRFRGEFTQACPAGQLAVGLRGRAGNYVDALGLVCGPAPKPPITALGKPKRPDPSPGASTSTGVGGILTGPSRWLPSEQTATVTGDVDLYDVPGGGGKVIGMLRAGQVVPFAGCRNDKWCEIRQPAGWVWGDFLTY